MENMQNEYGVRRKGSLTFRTFYLPCVILLLQFFFKFAQGQGPGQFQVHENRAPGTEVGTIQMDSSYTYTFSEGSNAKDYFSLDPNTGKITTKVTIDRELLNLQENKFSFLILGHTTDGSNSNIPIEVTIEILDENDNGPVFPNEAATVHFRENAKIGTQGYITTATDADDGINSLVNQYEITNGEGPFKLVFDPDMYGDVLIIETTGELDREKTNAYSLTIRAMDSGLPQRSGTTVINIFIDDENDNAPVFDPSERYAQVNETDKNGTFVIQLTALDLDTGVNQEILYKITDENEGSTQFRIGKSTGEIFTTRQPLSCPGGQCLLIIEARDKGVPSFSTRAFVYITVIDTNNHDPVIRFKYVPSGNEFSSINEDAEDGLIVAGVSVTDADAGSSPTARIVAGNELRHFRFQQFTTGLYFVKVNGDSVLDRERHHMYNLTVEASDNGNPPRMSTNSLIIYVNDINDHPPVFKNKMVKLSISETTEIGSFIESMLATDLDSGINAKLTYNIESGNDPTWFHIDKDTGLVTTQSKLHYEQQNYFHMNITVHDGALRPLKDFAELEITIWDENDMAPEFSQTVFNASLEENLASVSPVVSASAADHDSGLNGTIVYEFHPHVEILYPQTFHIDTNNGEVTTKKSLDREEIPNYTIHIIAKDKGTSPLTSTATVYLKVLDINDNSPVFYQKTYYSKIIEGQGQGTEVVKVTASDLDEGDNAEIIYSFSSSDFGKFAINSTTGIIHTTDILRKDVKSSYLISVVANDKTGLRFDTATVQVSVQSPTDSQPYFTSDSYKFSIPEDPGTSSPVYIGASVGKVTAKSDGSGSSIEYSIVEGDPTKVFSLDTATGWIRRSKGIDRELFPVLSLKVIATIGETFAETKVVITIKDDNDNAPVFEFPFLDIDVIENWAVGHYIALISATDADEEGPNSRVSYSLQRNQNNMFGIQSDTGVLYLNKPVKFLGTNQVTLTVLAMDAGTPTFTASQELRLKVKDVNNHTPKFAHTTYEMSLIESHPVNSRFFHVIAVDNDLGENGELTYNITRGNEDNRFDIFPDGHLYIAKELDRETKDLYKLSVVARDHGTQQRSSECNITIHIADFNDNKPIFLNATYGFNIQENKNAGSFVGHVRASDDDMGRNAELYYSFKDDQTDFHIDPQSGEITSLRVFDREQLADSEYMIVFDVVVKDNGLDRLEDVTTVRVTVVDENDNPPVFRLPVYKVTKFENEARFSNITVVKADDADAGINSIVTYSIIDGNEGGHFVISQTTGQITLDRQLDRETVDFYELTILATDSGETVRHNATCKVQIFVSDINDNFPLFAQSQMDISVSEDVEPGSEVAHFPATDIDIGVNAEITYQLSGKDNDGMFGIDRHTGKVYLMKKPDFETKRNYKLNVTATDKGVPALTYYIRFSITIDDVNDNAPVFQNQPLVFTIKENSSGSVTQILATDADSGKNGEVQYHIAYQDPPGENFKIVKNSGQIYIDKQIDRETTSSYKLTVVATDQAEIIAKRLKTEAVVTINVEDINDNDPLVTSFNAIAIPLSTPRNEYITTIKVKDKDSGNNGKFSLQLSQPGITLFSLDSNSYRLLLTNSLPNTPVKYSVTVQANDYGTPSQRTTQAAITIIVTNDENGPVFDSPAYNGMVVENSVSGKSILRVKATSRQNSPVEYYVTNITDSSSGKQVDRHFQVDRTSGVLSTAEVLDREVVGSAFDVEIYAIETSGSQPKTSVTVAHVELQDVNDTPPRFSQNYYTVDVDENVQTDFVVTRVAVYDDDSLGGLQLTLNVGSEVNLKINQDGTIVTTGSLDREVTPQYTLRITATDGIQSSSCMVRINLKDVNDNAPKFTQSFYSFDIYEDTLIGTTVGSIRAYDPDQGANGQVAYSLTSGWGNDTFSLDSTKGTFTLLRLLDFEENQLYTVQVNGYDFGDPAQTSSVLVYFNVKDTNDNTPVFEQGIYDVAISENVTVETSVVQVQAPDIDTGVNGQVSYQIIDGDIEGQFRIDTSSGVIYTSAVLDRETTPSYSLIVMATDMADNISQRKTATAEVLLTLLDVNDYIPEITSPAVIHVRENTPPGTVVHNITVRDLDEGASSQVEFSVVSKSGGKPFTVGTSDGQLRVNVDLDRESVQNYTLTVTVRDLGIPSLLATQTLVIKIEDENDHSPVFSPEFYDKEVREDVDIGTTLLQVSATDIDIGLNGIVKFFIISGDDNSDFSLDQSSGVLRVQKSLNYERVTKYGLVIQAEDSGENMRYSTATVSITVLDVNDNVPMFLDSPYIGFVRENMNALPVHVLNVLAHDEDSPPFNQLSYAIREGNRNLFNMSSATGEIMVLQTLDREMTSEYTLTVIATDSATGRGLTGSGTVSVFVEDVNDNPPVFDHVGNYVAHVPENADADREVIVVKATDADEGSNAQIIYRLTDSIDNKFMIYPNTGRIATRVRLNREEVSQYTLEVIAMDTSLLPLSSSTTVIVNVEDMNDNAPEFSSQGYTRDLQLPISTGTFVLGVSATDLDSGNNRLVEYSISQPDAVFFSIDVKTGVIIAKQALTSGRTYNFQVTAKDKGSPVRSSMVPVTVRVLASSGVILPTFGIIPTNLKVVENLAVDHVVTTVTATSSNNAPIVYSIDGGNLGEAFGIESGTGKINVNGLIDYEVIQEYHLWVKATESGSSQASSYAEIVIGVVDENDNEPRFSKSLYNVSIAEDEQFGTTVVTVTADDADSGSNGEVTYSLSGTDHEKFRIESNTGKIKTYAPLDREKTDMYSLTVTATDSGSTRKSSTASVRINVLDVNDESPAFSRQFRVKIPENMEVGSFVLRVTSSDGDIGQNAVATYSLTDDAGGIFSIDSISGNITLQKPLDAEQTSSYRLRVLATDGAHDVQGNVEVDISDVNDNNPVLTQPFSFDIEEMLPPGSFVGELTATDADISAPNNHVYFSLKLASSYFDLDSDTGRITSLDELTFDPTLELTSLPNRHELVVLVKDLGTPVRSSEQTVYVNVVDYNDHAPVFKQAKYESAVPETTQRGNSIITVDAIDEFDHGDNAKIEYFPAGGNGSSFFTVDKFSGIISVTKDLIGNANKEFILVVQAQDKGSNPQSSTVNVRLVVTDENLYAPSFMAPATKEITVNENTAVGSLIETFKASDNDRSLNAEVVYEITGGNGDDVFSLDGDNGKLSVKGMLDYELVKKYTLDITARDRALIPRYTTMSYTVKLRDLNDNDPIFGQTVDIVFVEENSRLGTSVYHAVAVDIDSGENAVIRYAIVGEGDPDNKFQINGITGVVTTRGALDYETTNMYTLTIMALNSDSSHKSTMSLTVHVDGVNEFIPKFVKDSYYFSISESAATKTSVGQVLATDEDSGPDGIVNYFLIGDSNAKGFKIDPRTGIILVSGQPDYESSPSITLEVLAKNWGSVKGNDTDTCTVHISVQDANDPPKFKQDVYQANILENSGADVSVVTVIAQDYDFEPSDRIFSYVILTGNSKSLFKIKSKTGYISTTGLGILDRETVSMYNITVGAVDTGSPPETGSAIVHVHLDDVNDNGPQFTNFTATVAEGQISNTLVTTLTQFTTDPDDVGNQGPYTYRKLTGSHIEYDYFDIIEKTGEIRTKKVLDRESIPEFIIPVIVKDGGSPTQSSTLSFKVMVTDINDTPPSPRFLTIFLSLYNGRRREGPIADVRPVDQDIDGRPVCTLRSSNTPFSMVPGGCNLLLNENPVETSYTLEVQAVDSAFDPITYDVSVKVINIDNDTLEHSTIIHIAGLNSDQFMSNVYTNFVPSVKKLFESHDEVLIYALSDLSGDLLVYLAVKKTGNEYYYSDTLRQKLSAAQSSIQSASSIFIISVDYSECLGNNCNNGGNCASHVTVGSASHNADSERQAFSSPSVDLVSYCACPAEYTGPDCSEPAKPCGNTFCQNGGICDQRKCVCSSEWSGENCGTDVNECQQNVCQNGGSCENLAGSYICHCVDGYSGKMCQDGEDYCESDPCVKGTCKNMVDTFKCECPYSYWGDLCQFSSIGFSETSYMVFPSLSEMNNELEVIFATEKETALLLYNPSSIPSSSEFIALEILDGRIRFSVALGAGEVTRVNINKRVNTGSWFKVKVNRNRDMSRVWVEDCPEDGGPCEECQIGTTCYSQQKTADNERLEVGTHLVLIGGVKTVDTILNRTGQVSSHDFVGCMRSFFINGQDKLQTTPKEQAGILDQCPRKSGEDVCQNYECKNGGICMREWAGPVCHCTAKYSGPHCEQALKPFQFGPDSFVQITMKESVRRDDQLAAASSTRRRRATGDSSVLVRFRTTASYGVLLFASTLGGSRYSVLSVFDGQLKFTVKQYGASKSTIVSSPSVSDGEWHNATVTVTASEISLRLDAGLPSRSDTSTFKFSSHDVKELTLGGVSSAVTSITVDNQSLDDFSGCISVFELDGKQLPMNGTTTKYNIKPMGGTSNGCTSLCENNACNGKDCSVEGEAIVCAVPDEEPALSIGLIIMIVFFVILLIVIVIVFIVLRQRLKLCLKGKQQKQNGTLFSNSVNSSGQSNQDSGYGENNIDKLIIRNHIAQELAGSNYQRQNGQLMKPDIIKSDIGRSPMPLEMEDGTVIIDNASDLTHLRDLNGEMPEHYDLENASSIAPSDIDIVDHYRHFHDGGKNRRKNKAHSDHSHNSKHSSRHFQSNHGSSHHSHQVRDSPNLLTSVPYLNDLARGSPSNTRNSPINQLSRQSPNVRQSPLTHVNMHGHNMPVTDLNGGSRTTSERSLASHRSKQSNSTPNKPKRQMLPNGNPPHSKKPSNHNYENSKFLTLEEVDRLNARPRESPASLMEAFSTSSENNTRKIQKPFEHYQDTSVLLEPPESSSDDSANDSFTCSEFEYENDKPRNDFDPNSRIFSNLTEVENENEDGAYLNKNFKTDGLDSGGNSFSSNERSSDDNQGQSKVPNNAFNWDDLLNWGPKFEKLVGVFTDIALLPDADSVDFVEVEGKTTEREEYV